MGPFDIVSVQQNTLTIDEYGIRITVLIARATLAPSDRPLTDASQRFPVENDLPMDLDASK